jgi:hypothetical protein
VAKTTGLGWTTFTVDDSTGVAQAGVRTDVTDVDFTTPRTAQEITSIDLSAHERLLLLADFSISLKGNFNDATGQSHAVFKTVGVSGVSRLTTMTVAGATLAPRVLYEEYTVQRAANGSLMWDAKGLLADGTVPTWS